MKQETTSFAQCQRLIAGPESVKRMWFYLVLVPLTWAGTALVETMIDAGM